MSRIKGIGKVIFILIIGINMLFGKTNVSSLEGANFNEFIKKNKTVIVKFSAPWCGACKLMKESYETIATELTPSVAFAEVNTENEEKLAIVHKITSLPTVILFKNGKEVDRYSGSLDEEEIAIFIDAKAVVSKYKERCIKRDALYCQKMALLYDDGLGVNVNKKIAIKFYKKACDLGEVRSCFNIGYMYDLAEGVEEDNAKAVKFYREACSKKHKIACHNLALMYKNGEGVNVDNNLSLQLYKQACDLSYGDSCYNLGFIYSHGETVDKNLLIAKKYFILGCSHNSDDACEEAKKLIK